VQAELRVEFTEYLDDYFPGIVRCEFADAAGRQHAIVDKVPRITALSPGADSSYPQSGTARCKVLSQLKGDKGEDLVRITIAEPDSLETVDGRTEFVVLAELVSGDIEAL
jgi:hypothetical protein